MSEVTVKAGDRVGGGRFALNPKRQDRGAREMLKLEPAHRMGTVIRVDAGRALIRWDSREVQWIAVREIRPA